MNLAELRKLERYLTEQEREEMLRLVMADMAAVKWRAFADSPQLQAYNSMADITGYGGSAGGGKTDLIAGLVTTVHERSLVVRREKAQTEGVIQRLTEILGNTNGFNSTKAIWRIASDRLCEFAGLDNPGDEKRWQGRPHDLKAFDEVTEMREDQVRFVMGWMRTSSKAVKSRVIMTFNPPTTPEGRWVLDFFGPWLNPQHPLYPVPPGELRYAAMLPEPGGTSADRWMPDGRAFVLVNGEPCYEFNPDDYSPEQIIVPKSRTFIPARLTDNPIYMATGYMSTLQALPEPLRSQMLYGDFQAGVVDDAWQLLPTGWVDAAQARWKPIEPKGEMLSMGIDVARGGRDSTTIGKRHATPDGGRYWYDRIDTHKGTDTPNGPLVAGLAIGARRDDAPMHIDVIGVGASPYDVLNSMGLPVYGINVAEKAIGTDKSGKLRFINRRSELYWHLRELLDPANNTGIALPPDPELKKELCAITWRMTGFTIQVASRDEIWEKVKRSIDRATAIMLASIDTPKVHLLRNQRAQVDALNYDPIANTRGPAADLGDYDPMRR
jgi:hypothetical protein